MITKHETFRYGQKFTAITNRNVPIELMLVQVNYGVCCMIVSGNPSGNNTLQDSVGNRLREPVPVRRVGEITGEEIDQMMDYMFIKQQSFRPIFKKGVEE